MTGDHHHIGEFRKKRGNKYDTKSKLLVLIFIIIISLLIITYEQLILIVFLVIYYIKIWQVSLRSLMKKLIVPLPLIISLAILSFFSESVNNLYFAGFSISYTHLESSIFYFLRALILVVTAIAMVDSEESFFEIIYALDEFGMPDIIISILLLMYRSSLDLYVEAKRMIDVRYSRSSYKRWGTNLYTYRIIGYMIAGILVRAFINKDKRTDTLYSRNFNGHLYHKPKPFKFGGIFMLWISSIYLIIVLLLTNVQFLFIGQLNQG
ncbi:MAG: hypothetical protein INQ03_17180 [Candidatus Heimdallarchaeota archaeon]|nr:hypothetical protein [Candidatus Heimdallarchaeota archaeon]